MFDHMTGRGDPGDALNVVVIIALFLSDEYLVRNIWIFRSDLSVNDSIFGES
jgi:hypothetical protein